MGEIDSKEKQKVLKKKREIRNLRKQQKRENNRKRKERKIKLIKLGTLFRILNLLDEKQEVMLGFLEIYLKLTIPKKEKLRVVGDKILGENKLKNYDDDLNDRKNVLSDDKKSSSFRKVKYSLRRSKNYFRFYR